uniref:Cysteine and glycine rich protein 1 n=1 Tax=Eptatretus burgeri TaxID=7764 RepID=A0A8C4QMQ4_EPTBU
MECPSHNKISQTQNEDLYSNRCMYKSVILLDNAQLSLFIISLLPCQEEPVDCQLIADYYQWLTVSSIYIQTPLPSPPPSSKVWHQSCFCCAKCGKRLASGTMTDREGDIYCNGCYAKYFGPKGVGFGQGAGALAHAQ